MTSGGFSGDTQSIEDRGSSPDHSGDHSLPLAGDLIKAFASSTPKKRKSVHKKVVSIPIKDLDSSSRNKGEAAPPSDSWTWRKYGQKPIKGSPYPRGYYRCSSSKGCPARKQVERSRVDPAMLVITYSADHNHPWPPSSRTHPNHNHAKRHSPPSSAVDGGVSPNTSDVQEPNDPYENNKFATINVAVADDGFHGWLADMSFATMLECPMLAETSSNDAEESMLFPSMGEDEDQSFYADLGELPECSMVFRRREVMAAGGTQLYRTTS